MPHFSKSIKRRKSNNREISICENYLKSVFEEDYQKQINWLQSINMNNRYSYYYSDLVACYKKIVRICVFLNADFLFGRICFIEILNFCVREKRNFHELNSIIDCFLYMTVNGSHSSIEKKFQFEKLTKNELFYLF